MHLERLIADVVTSFEPFDNVWLTSRGKNVGSQSWCWTISFETTPAGLLPGHRIISGIRNAPSQFVFFSLRKGVMPPSGHVFICGVSC